MEDARLYTGSSVCFGCVVDSQIVAILFSVPVLFDHDGAIATAIDDDF